MKSCLCFIMLSLISALLSCACKIDDDKVGDHFYSSHELYETRYAYDMNTGDDYYHVFEYYCTPGENHLYTVSKYTEHYFRKSSYSEKNGAQLCAIVQSLSVSADYSTCYTTGGEKNQTFSESGTTCTYIIPANLTYWHCRYQ